MAITTKIEAYRGDTVMVPIRAQVPAGATVRIHMRKTAQSEGFYLLAIVGKYVAILPQVSEQCEGNYILEIEGTLADGTVTTLQRTTVNFIPDVTRSYGSEESMLSANLERNVIVSKVFYIRLPDNTLMELLPGTGEGGGTGTPSKIDGGNAQQQTT